MVISNYGEKRREEIRKFIEQKKPKFLTLFEAKKWMDSHPSTALLAVLDHNIVAALDYEPIRICWYIRPLEEASWSKQKFVDYWDTKYEIEVQDFDYIVGLAFDGYYGPVIYDYPSSLISTFLRIPKKPLELIP